MKSKVFSIGIHNDPLYPEIWIYRTDGKDHGGGLRFYTLTVPRLIRVLRAMVNVSTAHRCYTSRLSRIDHWTIAGVVEQMYAAQDAIAAA